MPTVALESSFLEALTRLPQAQQKKVREFTKKFLIDPTAASINYENIHGTVVDADAHRPNLLVLHAMDILVVDTRGSRVDQEFLRELPDLLLLCLGQPG